MFLNIKIIYYKIIAKIIAKPFYFFISFGGINYHGFQKDKGRNHPLAYFIE